MDGEDDLNPAGLHEAKVDYKIYKIEDDNYVVWKWQIVNILKAKNLYKAISDQNADELVKKQALALLGSALNTENMALVVGCETPIDVWNRLEIVLKIRPPSRS